MNVKDLLLYLLASDVKLRLTDGGQLSIDAPKGRLTGELLERVRQNKAELVELLGREKGDPASGELPLIEVDTANLHEPFPAADLQAAFLIGDGESMEFHVRPHYYTEQDFDELDPSRYEQALNAALRRQRANIVVVRDDLHLQVLKDFAPMRVPVQDLRALRPKQADAALLATRAEMSRQALPLDRWPWLDCRISLHTDANGAPKARLHFNNNNVFCDGFGSQKLMADAMHFYERPDRPLPALSLSFRDCVLALARIEESPQGQASRRYWTERLPHLPGPPALPMRVGADPRARSMLERRQRVLPEQAWSSFKAHARRHGLTANNALFAVYAELVSCWSGSRHFLLNNMVTHRFPMHPEVTETLGNFASLYPLEVDWRGECAFVERAGRLQERMMGDLQHAYWSGSKVLQALNEIRKTPGRAPCPFVIGSGLFMKPYARPLVGCLETPQTALDHQFWELADGGLWFVWDLIEDFFPEGMIDAMWDAYLRLMTRLADDGDAWSCRSFDLLPAAQRRQREAINAAAMAAVPQGLLHEPLAQRAMLHPEKIALVTPDRSLTFAQLDRHADAVASSLLQAGARPGERVAVLLDKGWAQAVAVFGVLKAGGVYVPMDPDWPRERVHRLLSHIDARILLTRQGLMLDGQAASALRDGVSSLAVDGIGVTDTGCGPAAVPRGQQDLAYIIFTSGSTGLPKGVMIDHLGALNTVVDINTRFGITRNDVVYGVSSLCFDLSVYDLFGSVASGATLVLPNAAGASEPQAWLDAIRTHQVTVWNSVPALMQLLVDAAQAGGFSLPSLRVVMLSGDWIPTNLPKQIGQVAPNARVISLGGATEASIWSIHHPVADLDAAAKRVSIPYGLPLANQRWHVLDDMGRDVPDWVPGHLHIGGIGLAMGYWEDPQKTDASFIFHETRGERLYRTGDLGRYLPDGEIEFLGRSDCQVKIQGIRVELGEIEQALIAHPSVHTAVVIAAGSATGRRLHAFIVGQDGAPAPDVMQIQAHLRSRLPRAVVPNQVTVVDRLPLTANGKVDRQALHDTHVEGAPQPQRTAYVAARSAVERDLVAIWEEVLDQQPIGVHDDFFEMGGQSFTAVRMMTRIHRRFGQRLPLADLLEGRSIAHLAERLARERPWSPLVTMAPGDPDRRPCFFVHPAGGNVLCYRDLASRLGRPFFGLQAAGLSGEQPPLRQVEAMAALYLSFLREAQPNGPYLLGGWSSGGVVAFEIARQLEQAGERVERVVLIDTPAPLRAGPPGARALALWFLEDLDIGFDPARLREADLPEAPPGETLAAALSLLRQRQSLAPGLAMQDLLPIFQVFSGVLHATRSYEPGRVRAALSVFKAGEGCVSEFTGHPGADSADWGWGRHTARGVATQRLPGSHHTMWKPPHLPALLEALRRHLATPSAWAGLD